MKPHRMTRRTLATMAGAVAGGFGDIGSSVASSIDGRGVTNADLIAGFQAVRSAPVRFQDGQPFSIGAFHGRALLVNFWANWCVNCLAEFQAMIELQKAAGGPSQFAVVLISQPRDWQADQMVARQHSLPFPLALVTEPSTPVGIEATAAMLLGNVVGSSAKYGLPVSYMANRSGELVFTSTGMTNWVSPPLIAKAAQALRS